MNDEQAARATIHAAQKKQLDELVQLLMNVIDAIEAYARHWGPFLKDKRVGLVTRDLRMALYWVQQEYDPNP